MDIKSTIAQLLRAPAYNPLHLLDSTCLPLLLEVDAVANSREPVHLSIVSLVQYSNTHVPLFLLLQLVSKGQSKTTQYDETRLSFTYLGGLGFLEVNQNREIFIWEEFVVDELV